MSLLTAQLVQAYSNRIKSAQIDTLAALEEVLNGVGLSVDQAGGAVTCFGADPVIRSPLRLGSAATIALLAKSVAAAAFHYWRGGPGQNIHVDLRKALHRLCPFYDNKWERIGRYPVRTTLEVGNDAMFDFYQTADGRWVFPQAGYANLRLATQRLLGVPLMRDALIKAIGQWTGRELEEAAHQAGAVIPMVRTLPEMLQEPQFTQTLAHLPLIEVTKLGESKPEPLLPVSAMPFSGYRALAMAHVIAGAGLGRSLALHGCDVLNLWRPGEGEHQITYCSAHVGMRSAWLDPRVDRPLLIDLLKGTDIFIQNRRPGFLREIGVTPEDAARDRPGIIYVSVSLHGNEGPWAERPGFDQSAGSVAGIMTLEGSIDRPQLPLINVVNDFLTPWLAQAGVVDALRRRAKEGGSYHVHVSLTRVALWILSLGIFDKEWAYQTADSSEVHRYLDPEIFTSITPMGEYQGVTDQVSMSLTPGSYDPVLVPQGSSRLEWR